jgi:hypothetical protein
LVLCLASCHQIYPFDPGTPPPVDLAASEQQPVDHGPLDGGPPSPEGLKMDTGPADATTPDQKPPPCQNPVCDQWPLCVCNGQACEIYSATLRICRAAGNTPHGAACTSSHSTECKPGTTCLKYSGWPGGTYTCRQYCLANADCTSLGAGSLCAADATIFLACTMDCDPVEQTGCPAGTQCTVYSYPAYAGTDCTPIGAKQAGDGCGAHYQCGPGLLCIGATPTCQPACDVNGSNTCGGGKCAKLTIKPIGSLQLGMCQ